MFDGICQFPVMKISSGQLMRSCKSSCEIQNSSGVNSCRAKYILRNIKCICILYHLTTLKWHRWLTPFLMEDNDLFILCSQSYGCWCPGGRLNKKDGLTRYGNSHVLTAVLSLTWKSPYVDKTVFILRRGPGDIEARASAVMAFT